MNWPSSAVSGPALSMADGRATPNATASVTGPVSSHSGSSAGHSHWSRSALARIAAWAWRASAPAFGTAGRAATAASTACAVAHWLTRHVSALKLASAAGLGTGTGHPVRCASTASSAHSRTQGKSPSARRAARMSLSVHGRDAHSVPQVADLGVTTDVASRVAAAVAISRSEPSFIFTRTGKSIPSEKTAACPAASVTRKRDWLGVAFIVAPTASRSSAAGSRWVILTAVFLMASGTSRAGICSAITRPSP